MSTQKSRVLIAGVVLVMVVGLVLTIKYANGVRQEEVLEKSVANRTKGNPDAPLKIIEFIDFQCPACARGAVMINQFMDENPGVVFLEMKYFPLSSHNQGFLAARYAQCAARQGQFWGMHDLILEKQQQWFPLSDARSAFDLYAEKIGLDFDILVECLSDESVSAEVMALRREGQSLGIKSTPTYFINGELVVGFRNLEERLKAFFDQR
jgi:protein-disulfide isomerase